MNRLTGQTKMEEQEVVIEETERVLLLFTKDGNKSGGYSLSGSDIKKAMVNYANEKFTTVDTANT